MTNLPIDDPSVPHPHSRHFPRRWQPEHERHLIIRSLCDKILINMIHDELIDPEARTKYGFKPLINLNLWNTYRKLWELRKRQGDYVKQICDTHWNNWLEVPLARKRERLVERAKLYKDSKDNSFKRKILRDIQAEAGEEQYLNAIRESGTKIVQINVDPAVLLAMCEMIKERYSNVSSQLSQEKIQSIGEEDGFIPERKP